MRDYSVPLALAPAMIDAMRIMRCMPFLDDEQTVMKPGRHALRKGVGRPGQKRPVNLQPRSHMPPQHEGRWIGTRRKQFHYVESHLVWELSHPE
jgi:hypothetical protein